MDCRPDEKETEADVAPTSRSEARRSPPAVSVGKVLASTRRLAILAPPGGGKSTLLKRLAIAYAFPERIGDVADDLP